MTEVLIPTKLDDVAREILEKQGVTVVQAPDVPLPELIRAHPNAQALIVRSEEVDAETIDALPELRLIVRAGAGYDTIDVAHARRRKVDVMNTPGANANAVAEEVFALLLAHYRHVPTADASVRQGLWEKKRFMGRELAGKTIGIVGLGNIGQLVARRAAGFDLRMIGYDPVISSGKANDIGVSLVDLPTVFREADVVTLHVPETRETKGMVGKSLLSLMKPDATLINCARAGIVDEDDLREAKRERAIGFCNDVYPEDAPGAKSVADVADVMLPHLGASTYEANYNAARRAAEQLVAYMERGITKYVVNKGVPDDLDEGYQQVAYHIVVFARHYLGRDKPVRRIECSFYGGLDQYAKWFLSPIAAGLSADFDAMHDPQAAEEYFQEQGISVEIRPTDESKRYGKSMTIDLVEGADAIQQVSIRGILAEGNVMISRINAFEQLYFRPQGNNLIVVYRDRPGVLASVTAACADADINIDDLRAHRETTATKAIALLKTNCPVPVEVVDRIRAAIDPEVAFTFSMP